MKKIFQEFRTPNGRNWYEDDNVIWWTRAIEKESARTGVAIMKQDKVNFSEVEYLK